MTRENRIKDITYGKLSFMEG